MLNPNIGKLIQNSDNRYRLVIDVAYNARKISAKAEADGEIIVENVEPTGCRFTVYLPLKR